MKRILMIVLFAITVKGLFAQGQVVWKDVDGNNLPDTFELHRLPQHDQVVFDALISNISTSGYKVLLKRTIIGYMDGASDQLCYGISCQAGDMNKPAITTSSTIQLAGTDVRTTVPFEMIHYIPNELAGTTILKYYIMTENAGDTTIQDSVVVKYIIEPYKRVDLRFSVDMSQVSGFDPAQDTVYVECAGLVKKKMKRSGTTLTYNLGSTGHYYVDGNLDYNYKYYIENLAETVQRSPLSVHEEVEIAINDVFDFFISAKTKAKSDVQVFPNPFSSQLFIENMESFSKVEISNILGQTLYSNKTVESNLTISTNELSGGIYFVRLTDANNKLITKRMVKK